MRDNLQDLRKRIAAAEEQRNLDIMSRAADGLTYEQIAAEFSITRQRVGQIISRKVKVDGHQPAQPAS